MRRSLLPATAALGTVTALVLLGAALTIRPSGPPSNADTSSREAANRALAYRFYAAANTAIATGDPAPLAALVADDFVERDAEADPGRDGLLGRLLLLHAAAPDVRIEVDALAADGDVVIAHVLVRGGDTGAFLGLRLDREWAAWGPVDVFRVERGRIAERWGAAVGPAPPAPVLSVALDVPGPEYRHLAVARVTLAPGARHAPPPLNGPRLLVVESGTVTLQAAAPGPGVPPPVTLGAGEHAVMPLGAGVAVWNASGSPVALLDAAVAVPPWNPSAAGSVVPPPEEGVEVQVLASDLVIAVPTGPVELGIGRATLVPGDGFGWTAAAGPVLLRVEAGAVAMAATGSVPWVDAVPVERSGTSVATALAGGAGALFEAGAAVEVRAGPGGPATLLVVTLLPGPSPVSHTVARATRSPAAA